MIFSENNYGRLEATALLLLWVAVGAAAMILMMDGAHLIGRGISSLRYVIRPGLSSVACYGSCRRRSRASGRSARSCAMITPRSRSS